MRFSNPVILLFIPVVLVLVLLLRSKERAGFIISSETLFSGLKKTWKIRAQQYLVVMRLIALVCMLIALARPQEPIAEAKIQSEGIDIVLALDCSGSMLSEDFILAGKREARVEVVKSVVREFIRGRSNDRIGIVAFAARAYTVCPLTLDYGWLLQNLERVKVGLIEDGTAIGSGIASSLSRLKDTQAKSKIIILLTDGRNNAGKISPLTAAEAARALKVKVYTIGVGSKGAVPFPVQDFFGRKIYQMIEADLDEETLAKIAELTDGKYFRATDSQALRNIYKEIDRMQKSPVEHKGYLQYNELFPYFLLPGLALLGVELMLRNTLLRTLP